MYSDFDILNHQFGAKILETQVPGSGNFRKEALKRDFAVDMSTYHLTTSEPSPQQAFWVLANTLGSGQRYTTPLKISKIMLKLFVAYI